MTKREKERQLHKKLSKEVNVKFELFLNGDLDATKKEVFEYSRKFENVDLSLIRAEKFRLQQKINDMVSLPKTTLLNKKTPNC